MTALTDDVRAILEEAANTLNDARRENETLAREMVELERAHLRVCEAFAVIQAERDALRRQLLDAVALRRQLLDAVGPALSTSTVLEETETALAAELGEDFDEPPVDEDEPPVDEDEPPVDYSDEGSLSDDVEPPDEWSEDVEDAQKRAEEIWEGLDIYARGQLVTTGDATHLDESEAVYDALKKIAFEAGKASQPPIDDAKLKKRKNRR